MRLIALGCMMEMLGIIAGGGHIQAADATSDVVVPVKVVISGQAPDTEVDWSKARPQVDLRHERNARYIAGFGPPQHGVFTMRFETAELGDKEWQLRITVSPRKEFPYEGEYQGKISTRSVAALELPLVLKLSPYQFRRVDLRLVSAADGRPVTNEKVVLMVKQDHSYNGVASGVSDREGRLSFPVTDKVTYFITAGRVGDIPGQNFVDVELTPDQVRALKGPIEIRVPAPLVIAELLEQVAGEKPKPMAEINCRVNLIGHRGTTTVVGLGNVENGKLYVYSAPPGRNEIMFKPDSQLAGYVFASGGTLEIGKSEAGTSHVQMVLRKAKSFPVRLVVKNADKEEPISGCIIRIAEKQRGREIFDGSTGKDGTVNLKMLREGTYEVILLATGFGPKQIDLTVSAEMSASFSLSPLRNITVVVSDPSGKPVNGAKVALSCVSDYRSATTNSEGVAVCSNLAEGDWILLGEHPSGRRGFVEPLSVKGNAKVNISLVTDIEVKGSVKFPPELKAPRILFLEQATKYPIADTMLAADGSFTMRALPAKYDAYVFSGDGPFYLVGSWQVTSPEKKEGPEFALTEDKMKNSLSRKELIGRFYLPSEQR